MVPQVDGLADGLETDALLAQARDGQRAGHGAGRDQDVVVLDLAGRPGDGLDQDLLVGVVDASDLTGDDRAAAQLPSQRHNGVPRGDVAGRRLGEERLIGHVRLRIDDDYLCLARAELLGEAQRGEKKADVPSSNHKDPLRTHEGYLSPNLLTLRGG